MNNLDDLKNCIHNNLNLNQQELSDLENMVTSLEMEFSKMENITSEYKKLWTNFTRVNAEKKHKILELERKTKIIESQAKPIVSAIETKLKEMKESKICTLESIFSQIAQIEADIASLKKLL